MAYRRVLSIQTTLLGRRFSPISFTYISHHDRCTKSEELHSFGSKMETFSNQRRSLVSYAFRPTPYGLAGNGVSLRRGISTSSGEATQGAASEFKAFIAATDSASPVAAVQYLIDYVHTLTGLNWWASIAVATLLVRGAMIPLYIIVPARKGSMKSSWRRRPLSYGFLCLSFLAEGSMMFSFFVAVMNMMEKVPSFKTGGALWFTDLSTPDPMFIFPISMTLLTLVRLEIPTRLEKVVLGSQLLAQHNTKLRALVVLSLPLTMCFPKAVFCFLITLEMFDMICLATLAALANDPRVKKALGIKRWKAVSPFKSSAYKRNKSKL